MNIPRWGLKATICFEYLPSLNVKVKLQLFFISGRDVKSSGYKNNNSCHIRYSVKFIFYTTCIHYEQRRYT